MNSMNYLAGIMCKGDFSFPFKGGSAALSHAKSRQLKGI